jgi:peroxiredoxin
MVQPRFIGVLALALALTPFTHALDLPRQSPEFTIQTTNGKPLQLSQYKGRAVVLAFILTNCPHCQKAVGFLAKDAVEFAPRGLQVLASAVDIGAAQKVPGFVRDFNPPFPVGFNADPNVVLDYMQHPRAVIPHMPMLVFIDKDGIIRAQLEGDSPLLEEKVMEENLRQQIDELLKGPAASKSVAKKAPGAPAAAPKKTP